MAQVEQLAPRPPQAVRTGNPVEQVGQGGRRRLEQVRLRVGDQINPPFSWATVGVDSIESVAAEGGLELTGLHHDSGRHVATLRPTEGHP